VVRARSGADAARPEAPTIARRRHLVEGYDLSIVTVALPLLLQLSPQPGAGVVVVGGSLSRLGAGLLPRPSKPIGSGAAVCSSCRCSPIPSLSVSTALAPTIETFAACQFAARAFLSAQIAITWTIAAKELPLGARGPLSVRLS
jgi:hypothetical protein